MSQVIIFKKELGGVALCIPTGEIPINEVLIKDCPEGAIIVDRSSLPNDYFDLFGAWELENTTVTVNFEKAKEITKDRLRVERQPFLQEQDIAFQRALESGADTSAIIAEKQRLRDITKLVDQATTLDELKQISI